MTLPTDDKSRKALPIFSYITEYFPDALIEETRVAVEGNRQHNPGEPLHWAREKSKDQVNTAFRHMLDHKMGNVKDTDGTYHLAKAIWRLKAELQLTIEAERADGLPFDPARRMEEIPDAAIFIPVPKHSPYKPEWSAEPNYEHVIEHPGLEPGPCRNAKCWCRIVPPAPP